jgi:collagenase-like PrtC family protease
MKYFSLPADLKTETIDKYVRLNSLYEDCRVVETYGNIKSGNMLGSGRSIDQLPEVDLSSLQDYIHYSRGRGIGFNYTLNTSHMHNREFTRKGIVEIMMFLASLYEAGVRCLTVTLPSVMEIVRHLRESKYDFEIKASAICQITTANRALVYKEMGARRIVADESLNRDFPALKRIMAAFGKHIEVIVNAVCFKDCPYRQFHYNQIASDSIDVSGAASANYYDHRCLLRRFQNPGNFLKLSWIRPEDLKYYTGLGIQYFKLQGRHTVANGDPARAVECYFKESYEGDLVELLDLFNPTSHFRPSIANEKLAGFIKPFYERENFCKNDCRNCNYCDSFASCCLDAGAVEELRRSARDFYRQYDQFNATLASLSRTKNGAGTRRENDIDVDFDIG